MKEELVVRVVLSDDEYISVMRSTLTHYITFLAHLAMSANLLGYKLYLDKVMLLLTQEYNCLNLLGIKFTKDEKGLAFVATSRGSRTSSGQQK